MAPARQRGRGGSPVIGFIEVIWNFFWRLWEGMRERCLRELGRGGGSRIRLEWRKGGGRKETKEERERIFGHGIKGAIIEGKERRNIGRICALSGRM